MWYFRSFKLITVIFFGILMRSLRSGKERRKWRQRPSVFFLGVGDKTVFHEIRFCMKFGFAVLYKKSRPESASFVKIGSIKSDAALKSIK